MTLAVVGMGLVSPFGCSPREHVFFRRANVPGPFSPPFARADGEPLRLYFCPWLDAALGPGERITALATTALEEALRPLEAGGAAPSAIALCLARARPGLDERAQETITDSLQARYRPSSLKRYWAEAGVFAALADAQSEIARGDMEMVAIVAADSHASIEWLTHQVQSPPTRWESSRPRPSEAAAALLIMSPEAAHRLRLPTLATIHRSTIAMGSASDDNDERPDARAMGAALHEVGSGHVSYSFGQDVLDDLRREEWHHAVARQATRFWECQHDCLEADVGLIGAASGAASLVYGATALRLGAAEGPGSPAEPFLAWAISRDGSCGVASASVEVE